MSVSLSAGKHIVSSIWLYVIKIVPQCLVDCLINHKDVILACLGFSVFFRQASITSENFIDMNRKESGVDITPQGGTAQKTALPGDERELEYSGCVS